MKVRLASLLAGVVLAGAAGPSVLAQAPGQAATLASSRPNIILITAEDMSPRVGAFGDPVARTPNLDALAREGVRYTNVFATAAVCAPSRSALITGRSPADAGDDAYANDQLRQGYGSRCAV